MWIPFSIETRYMTCTRNDLMNSFADLKCAVAITNTEGIIAVNDLNQVTELDDSTWPTHSLSPLAKLM